MNIPALLHSNLLGHRDEGKETVSAVITGVRFKSTRLKVDKPGEKLIFRAVMHRVMQMTDVNVVRLKQSMSYGEKTTIKFLK